MDRRRSRRTLTCRFLHAQGFGLAVDKASRGSLRKNLATFLPNANRGMMDDTFAQRVSSGDAGDLVVAKIYMAVNAMPF